MRGDFDLMCDQGTTHHQEGHRVAFWELTVDGKVWRDGRAQGEESGLYLEDPVCFRKVMSAEGLYFRKLTAVR